MVLKKSGLGAQLRKLPRGPDLAELHQLLSQCMEQRGRVVKLAWRGANLTPFQLEVVCHLKHGNPQWRLFSEQNPQALFDYTSVDVLLVYNLVASHCAEVQQQTSRGSMAESQQRMPAVRPDPPLPIYPQADTADYQYAAPEEDSPLIVQPVPQAPQQQRVQTPSFAPVPPKPALAPQYDTVPKEGTLIPGSLVDLLTEIYRVGATGRLDIRNGEAIATVFIQDGRPVDATANDVVGDEAMIEVLTWKEGNFSFEPRVLRNNHTVYESIENLVAQSRQLTERITYLKNAGMTPSSALVPTNTMLSQGDFMARVQENCPSDLDTISRVYCSLDGRRTFEELCRFVHVSRIQLVHMVFHLVIKELVKIVEPPKSKSTLTLAPKVIDNAAIQSIMMSLRRAETGLFIYPAFLYFLEQEYFRSYRSRASFSVVVFELRQKKVIDGKVVRRVLNERAQMDAILRISGIKRHVDMIAHYDAYDYALLLPSTKTQGAEIFLSRIIEALRDKPLGGEIDASQLAMAFGCSSIPEDFRDMSSLLGAADLAMNQARESDKAVVMYRDIKANVE